MLIDSREAKVGHVPAALIPPGRELNRPGFEENKFGGGFYAKTG